MAEMSEVEFKIFIEAVTHYFSHVTGESAAIRSSFLAGSSALCFEYTGLIDLSGRFRGSVYFTAPGRMLRALLRAMQESDTQDENLLDIVGEVANTIAGNARRHFGSALEISVPRRIRGASEAIASTVRARPFAVMFNWHRHEAAIVIDLEAVA
ncbi:MAG TPA: chemotaxis protein CheX [Burkholderiales bacterium]|nr:chemotaxis protein CheX [Burkholderiales bacterium]